MSERSLSRRRSCTDVATLSLNYTAGILYSAKGILKSHQKQYSCAEGWCIKT